LQLVINFDPVEALYFTPTFGETLTKVTQMTQVMANTAEEMYLIVEM